MVQLHSSSPPPKRGRGRPRSTNAKSGAQRAKEYREKHLDASRLSKKLDNQRRRRQLLEAGGKALTKARKRDSENSRNSYLRRKEKEIVAKAESRGREATSTTSHTAPRSLLPARSTRSLPQPIAEDSSDDENPPRRQARTTRLAERALPWSDSDDEPWPPRRRSRAARLLGQAPHVPPGLPPDTSNTLPLASSTHFAHFTDFVPRRANAMYGDEELFHCGLGNHCSSRRAVHGRASLAPLYPGKSPGDIRPPGIRLMAPTGYIFVNPPICPACTAKHKVKNPANEYTDSESDRDWERVGPPRAELDAASDTEIQPEELADLVADLRPSELGLPLERRRQSMHGCLDRMGWMGGYFTAGAENESVACIGALAGVCFAPATLWDQREIGEMFAGDRTVVLWSDEVGDWVRTNPKVCPDCRANPDEWVVRMGKLGNRWAMEHKLRHQRPLFWPPVSLSDEEEGGIE